MDRRTCLRAANAVMAVAAIATALAVFGPAAWSMATAPRLPVIDPESVARRSAILDAQLEVLRDRQRELGLIPGRDRVVEVGDEEDVEHGGPRCTVVPDNQGAGRREVVWSVGRGRVGSDGEPGEAGVALGRAERVQEPYSDLP